MPGEKKLNRIKVVLAERGKTALWLAEQLGRDVGTVSRWNRNVQQPSLELLFEIAAVLEVDVRELLAPNQREGKG